MAKLSIEELEDRLASAQNDAQKIAALNALARELNSSDTTRAFHLAEEAYQLASQAQDIPGLADSLLLIGAYQFEYGNTIQSEQDLLRSLDYFRQLNDLTGQGRALHSLGWCYYLRGEYERSLVSHNQALSIRESIGDPLEIADSYNGLSAVYGDQGKYPESMKSLLMALDLAEKSQSPRDQVRFLTNIGSIYMEVGENEQAITTLKQVVDVAEKIGVEKYKIFALGSLGLVYRETGEYPLSLEYSLRSLELRADMMPRYERADTLINVGDVYRRMGDLENALPLLQEGLDLAIEINNATAVAKGLMAMGYYHLARGQVNLALETLQASMAKAREIEYQQVIYLIHQALADTLAQMGDYAAAYDHYRLFEKTKEVVFNRESISRRKLLELQVVLDRARDERQVAEALRLAGAALNQTLDFEQVLDLMLTQIQNIVPYQAASILLVENEIAHTVRAIGNGPILKNIIKQLKVQHYDIQQTPNLKWMSDHSQPLAISDTVIYPGFPFEKDGEVIHSWVGSPIIGHNQIMGFLCLYDSRRNVFQAQHAGYLAIYASQAALAMENAHLFAKVERLAITDGLTGLYNHRHLYDLGQREFYRNRRYGSPLSAIMMDLDHFKLVNDTHGHIAGDRVLKEVSNRCLECLRKGDIIGRYGGEEFVILLPEIDMENAIQVAEKIRETIEQVSIQSDHGVVRVTASLGVATLTNRHARLENLIDSADTALYRAKRAGRNRVSI